jgi:hypothetical protein
MALRWLRLLVRSRAALSRGGLGRP